MSVLSFLSCLYRTAAEMAKVFAVSYELFQVLKCTDVKKWGLSAFMKQDICKNQNKNQKSCDRIIWFYLQIILIRFVSFVIFRLQYNPSVIILLMTESVLDVDPTSILILHFFFTFK